ncbi:P-loop containing nucleoside triphosphate hydrolase protein [Achaetomium macrosporum]|uniref:DNA 3'-5' helicase n=1 Tax=Achaetomium macrosporum TaxID=79813 RepID=A0AAN7H8M7_9PEZI|nr:P-loop containing nucleoside triphosphate hydrolase protein [Achaetomium macrosporum]
MGDDSDFEVDVFDRVGEAELAELERPRKSQRISKGLPDSREDDVFDDLDEADLAELERPTKRLKTSAGVSNAQSHLALAERILKEKFGYPSFRHEQAGAIQSILAGDNALVIFPTGAGKSLCYQIPAIAFPELDKANNRRGSSTAGVTLVVSPLIALMKDQVDALKKRGIPADSIDSSKSWDDIQRIYASLRESKLRILYCAPERLNNEGFVATIGDIPGGIRLLAVDEAHCVSEWGYSFRPEYLKVARFADEVKAERVICLTATATPDVAKDICKTFRIKDACVFLTSVYRPNIMLGTRMPKLKTECDNRFEELFSFLRTHPGPTLVYVALQQQAETHAQVLKDQGFNAAAFHAGMKKEEKLFVQDDFMTGKIQIVCATIAFGMGIDKPDIRNVIHWDLASTVEEYSQQIGRAGRDGKKSYCMFYLAPSAFYLRQVFARGDLPARQSLKRLISNILDQARGLGVNQVFKVSHYQQEREYDIRASPLSIIYATLELHFGFVRAITPEYTTYKFEAMRSYYPKIKEDKSKEAKAILSSATKKLKFHHIDVNAAARDAGLDRNDIVKKLNQLNERGHIKLQTKGLEHRYVIQKELPKTKEDIEAVVDKIYAQLQQRERDALNRGREVMDLITGNKCFARALAEHFGMGLPGGKPSCGHCTYCFTRRSVRPPAQPREPTTAASIQRVLQATTVRDDPRFLARVAYGIKSPRVTQLKLDKSPVFRSLAHHDFEVCTV